MQKSGNTESWMQYTEHTTPDLRATRPIVAFETTVLSFGLPWPTNRDVALSCEAIAREHGVTPATLGVLNRKAVVGLSEEQLDLFCRPKRGAVKVNLQNLAAALQLDTPGALTVATTLNVASQADIRVAVTGGIGGVHRGYAESHDVSSDLVALARFPVAMVCSGIKSILDVPATLERLETLGVPVVGYKTRTFPFFYAGESNIELETTTDSLEEVAAIAQTHWNIGGRGILVVTPVPAQHAVAPVELEEWIADANRVAQIGRVSGKAVTPFLLKKLEEFSRGKSLAANVALLENNAHVGSQLAVELHKTRG